MSAPKAQRESWVAIQILRGIAALAVVLHHIPQYIVSRSLIPAYTLESGAAGVDIFFVISGFVMHAATVNRHNQPLDFFVRRLARIVPIYWLISTTLFVATIVLPSAFGSFKTAPEIWLKSILFIPIFDAKGFIRPLISQGWTLYFELTFYLILTFSLLLVKRYQTLLAALIVLALSVLVSTLTSSSLHSWLQLLAPITLEFCAGVIIAHVFCYPGVMSTLGRLPALPAGGLALSLASLYFFKDGVSAELGYPRVLGWGLGAVLLVAGALLLEPVLKRLPHPLDYLKKLGDASYSLYLIHGLLFSVAWKLAPSGIKHSEWGLPALLTLIPLVVAWPFHRYVETPLNRQALKLIPRIIEIPSK